jgi:DNA-directed RNA polymerase subunit beta'
VLGLHYITSIVPDARGEGRAFAGVDEALAAYDLGQVAVNARIITPRPDKPAELTETTLGRLLFHEILPEGYGFINEILDKPRLRRIIGDVLSDHGQEVCAAFLDEMKGLGFRFATASGLSWGMNDLTVPEPKTKILRAAEEKVDKIRQQFEEGLLTDEERYRMTVTVWEEAREEMNSLAQSVLDKHGTVFSMVSSGARGSWTQIMQMMGMKGTVAGPTGEVVEVPIKSSFKEGFTALEYFLSTHGTRKGMADTALRTATAGYLTRRLVNVAQDVVVHIKDCRDTEGGLVTLEDTKEIGITLGARVQGRVLAEPVRRPRGGKVLFKRGTLLGREEAKKLDDLGIEEVVIRSVVTCKAQRGICQTCYGWDLGRGRVVDIGEPVGVVAAQAIGEPGTQLTMRTFHAGGVAGEDITQGLPRVEELFEARIPRSVAPLSEIDGVVSITPADREVRIMVTSKGSKVREYDISGAPAGAAVKSGKKVAEGDKLFVDVNGDDVVSLWAGVVTVKDNKLTVRGRGKDVREYTVPANATLNVRDKQEIMAGHQLTEGHLDVQALFAAAGVRAVQRYILREVQQVYAIQGETINDKHLEIIVRQMLSRVRVHEAGDTSLLAGRTIELSEFQEANTQADATSKKRAAGERLLLGITKVSLTTRSFLAAASFMETARVLIDSAVTGRADHLEGMKENVIIGRLIPVGTGYRAPRVAEAEAASES